MTKEHIQFGEPSRIHHANLSHFVMFLFGSFFCLLILYYVESLHTMTVPALAGDLITAPIHMVFLWEKFFAILFLAAMSPFGVVMTPPLFGFAGFFLTLFLAAFVRSVSHVSAFALLIPVFFLTVYGFLLGNWAARQAARSSRRIFPVFLVTLLFWAALVSLHFGLSHVASMGYHFKIGV
ncbi:MAG: hypothetical protein IJ206_02485 [Oscillospiraceae bacterium]|nr:hypothetical protein [Oscillospiraceae bacterium]